MCQCSHEFALGRSTYRSPLWLWVTRVLGFQHVLTHSYINGWYMAHSLIFCIYHMWFLSYIERFCDISGNCVGDGTVGGGFYQKWQGKMIRDMLICVDIYIYTYQSMLIYDDIAFKFFIHGLSGTTDMFAPWNKCNKAIFVGKNILLLLYCLLVPWPQVPFFVERIKPISSAVNPTADPVR